MKKTSTTETNTKDRIFMAAAKLFATHGYERVSIRAICDEVGVGKPTLYYYFKDKETLLEALVDYSKELADALAAEFVRPEQTFEENMLGVIKVSQMFAKRYPYFVRFFTVLNLLALPERIREKLIQFHVNRFERIKTFFESGQKLGYIPADLDVDLLVISFIGSINQMVILEIYHPSRFSFNDQNARKFFELWKNRIFSQPNNGGQHA